MGWLVRHNWLWALLAFVLGAAITWFLQTRRERAQAKAAAKEQTREAAEESEESQVLVGAGVAAAGTAAAPPPHRFEDPAERLREEPVEAFDQTQHQESQVATPEPLPEPEPVESEEKAEPAPVVQAKAVAAPAFSRRMDVENGNTVPTLFDDPQLAADEVQAETDAIPPGRYGEGSAEAVPHQGPPDGFTIKGNMQSMLFHTPDSPYYGRTKPEVWFRAEADAERAGFSKYVRKPRKSASPGK
jgi:FtsZ-interacting cell division protein ZipA